jgi:alpha-1,6-mannosyltransferase
VSVGRAESVHGLLRIPRNVAVKIVDVTEFWSERGGGVRAYLTQLLREGKNRGHEVVVIAPGAQDQDIPYEGGRLVRLRGPAMPYDPSYHALYNPFAVAAAIEREQPDVVEASSPYLAALVATRVRHVRLRSMVIHSDFIDTYARPVLSRVLGNRATNVVLTPPWKALCALTARYDLTVCAGQWLADKLTAHGCPRVACVPFGIRHGELGVHHRDEVLRQKLLGSIAHDSKAYLIAVVGRLALEKRVALVLRGLAIVAKQHPISVVVLGDGPERKRLEALAKQLSLSVNFLGFISDRAQFATTLASTDALVHGCSCETFGFSVAEALASGVPVVVPDEGGASEFADPDASEHFPANGDAMAVAVATLRLLNRPRATLTSNALRAASRVRPASEHFDALFQRYQRTLDERTR